MNDDPNDSNQVSRLDSAPPCLPRILYTFWHDAQAMPELVKACIDLFRRSSPHWDVRVLSAATTDVDGPPVPAATMSPALLSDWYRLSALCATGGVYLDASCILLEPPQSWVDVDSNALQGFLCHLDGDTMESWAIAAPASNALLLRWRDRFRAALTQGPADYCAQLCEQGVITPGLRQALPYLTIHACWREARRELPHIPLQLASAVAAGGPMHYLALARHDSLTAISALFAASADDLEGTPFVKLRKCERDCVPPLAALGKESYLGRKLCPGMNGGAASRIQWLLSK